MALVNNAVNARVHSPQEGIAGEVRRLDAEPGHRLLTSLVSPTSEVRGEPVPATITPDELIKVLERGAAQGIDPRRILLALGFRPAGR